MAVKGSPAPAAVPSVRARHRLETRRRLYEAALSEFRRAGVTAAQVEDIVRRAGVARGTFYLHFPTKDHVVMELVRRKQERIARRLAHGQAGPLAAFLARLVERMWEDAAAEDPRLWHEMCAVIGRHAREMRGGEMPLVTSLVARLERARAEGEIRGDVAPFELAPVFLAGVYGLLQMILGLPRREALEALRRTVDIFLHGVEPVPAPAPRRAGNRGRKERQR